MCSRICCFKFRYICNCKLWKLYQRRVLPYARIIVCCKNIPFKNVWQISKMFWPSAESYPFYSTLDFIFCPIMRVGFIWNSPKCFPLGDFTLLLDSLIPEMQYNQYFCLFSSTTSPQGYEILQLKSALALKHCELVCHSFMNADKVYKIPAWKKRSLQLTYGNKSS